MPRKPTEDELEQLSDEERAALEDDENEDEDEDDGEDNETRRNDREAARLEKEFEKDDDDEDDDDDDGDEGATPAAAASPAAKASADATPGESDSGPSVELATPFAPTFSAPDTTEFDAKIEELVAKRKDIRKQYRAGDLDVEAYDDQIDSISSQISELEGRKREAQLTEQFNADIERSRWLDTVEQFKAHVKKADGIDYSDPANRTLEDRWDARVKELGAMDEHADKPWAWFLETAHREVMAEQEALAARLGFVKVPKGGAAPADPKAAALARRKPVLPPVGSLATVPTADNEGPAGGEFAHIDSLEGEAFERAIASMTPAQLERYEASR